jgi:hypothetical protein
MIPSKGLSREEWANIVEWANRLLPNANFKVYNTHKIFFNFFNSPLKSLEYSTSIMIDKEEEEISLELEATEPIEKIYELLGKAMAQREFDKIAQYLLRIKTILDALNVEDDQNQVFTI